VDDPAISSEPPAQLPFVPLPQGVNTVGVGPGLRVNVGVTDLERDAGREREAERVPLGICTRDFDALRGGEAEVLADPDAVPDAEALPLELPL
jgi:hypothetical protein